MSCEYTRNNIMIFKTVKTEIYAKKTYKQIYFVFIELLENVCWIFNIFRQ